MFTSEATQLNACRQSEMGYSIPLQRRMKSVNMEIIKISETKLGKETDS